MINDLMPRWLRKLLDMDRAELPGNWTWRHTCRFGRNPAKTMREAEQYRRARSPILAEVTA